MSILQLSRVLQKLHPMSNHCVAWDSRQWIDGELERNTVELPYFNWIISGTKISRSFIIRVTLVSIGRIDDKVYHFRCDYVLDTPWKSIELHVMGIMRLRWHWGGLRLVTKWLQRTNQIFSDLQDINSQLKRAFVRVLTNYCAVIHARFSTSELIWSGGPVDYEKLETLSDFSRLERSSDFSQRQWVYLIHIASTSAENYREFLGPLSFHHSRYVWCSNRHMQCTVLYSYKNWKAFSPFIQKRLLKEFHWWFQMRFPIQDSP